MIIFGDRAGAICFAFKSEVAVPSRELLVHLGVIDRETIKVDVGRALEEEWKL